MDSKKYRSSSFIKLTTFRAEGMWARQERRNLEEPYLSSPTKVEVQVSFDTTWLVVVKRPQAVATTNLGAPLRWGLLSSIPLYIPIYWLWHGKPAPAQWKEWDFLLLCPLVSLQHPLWVEPKTVLLARKNVHRLHLVYHKARQRGMDLELRGNILIVGTVGNFQICISYPDLSSKLQISGCLRIDATKAPQPRHVFFIIHMQLSRLVMPSEQCVWNTSLFFLNTYIYSITITTWYRFSSIRTSARVYNYITLHLSFPLTSF